MLIKVLHHVELYSWTIFWIGVGLCIGLLAGCAAVIDPVSGDVILGVKAGVIAESAEQSLVQGLGMIPLVGPILQSAAGTAILSGASVAGTARVLRNRLEAKRKASDRAREEAMAEVRELKAILAAKEA